MQKKVSNQVIIHRLVNRGSDWNYLCNRLVKADFNRSDLEWNKVTCKKCLAYGEKTGWYHATRRKRKN